MSKYISLKDGFYVKIENIEAIEFQDFSTTKVYTNNHIYESSIPVETLRSILDLYKSETPKDNSEDLAAIRESMLSVQKSSQYFAG